MNARDGSGDGMNEFLSTPSDLDDNTAERMLSGHVDPADAPPGYAGVTEVLAAASASALPSELAGESQALSMFRTQAHEEVPIADAAVVSLDERRTRRASRKAVLVGVVAGVILASTGVAAAGGDLPEPVQRVAHQTLSQIGVSVPDPQPKPAPDLRAADPRPNSNPKPTPPSTQQRQQVTPPSTPPRPSTSQRTPPSTVRSQPPATRGANPAPTGR